VDGDSVKAHHVGMKFPKKKPGQSFAFWFHWNLETIERAYKTSRMTPDAELADSRKREAKLRKAIAAGKASWVEYDEDGNPGFDYGEHLGEEQHGHEQSLSSTLYDYEAKHRAWAIRVRRWAGIYCGSRFGGER
jgi:hypothetical protein